MPPKGSGPLDQKVTAPDANDGVSAHGVTRCADACCSPFHRLSPDGIARPVQRCQHDGQPIQIVVARIIEDQVRQEQTAWGVA